jgi:hypothetical protein
VHSVLQCVYHQRLEDNGCVILLAHFKNIRQKMVSLCGEELNTQTNNINLDRISNFSAVIRLDEILFCALFIFNGN